MTDYEDTVESLAECARVNFENVIVQIPVLAKHATFMVAKHQLDEVCERLARSATAPPPEGGDNA